LRRPGPQKRLCGLSSPGVRPSDTVCPEVPACGLSTIRRLSWGVLPLQRSGRRESTARLLPDERPGFAGLPSAGPTPQATVPLTGFLSLSAAFFLPPPSCHFQTGGAPGVRPSGSSSTHAAPTTRRRRHALLTFLPTAGLPPRPRWGYRRASWPSPRISGPAPLFVFRAFVRVGVGLHHQSTLASW
jgi:hypothetical protein